MMNKVKAHSLFDNVSFADYLQMSAAAAIEASGGPKGLTIKSFMQFFLLTT